MFLVTSFLNSKSTNSFRAYKSEILYLSYIIFSFLGWSGIESNATEATTHQLYQSRMTMIVEQLVE
jgi:hypothetical protein